MIPGEKLLQLLQVLTYSDIGDFIEVRANGKMTFNDFPRKNLQPLNRCSLMLIKT